MIPFRQFGEIFRLGLLQYFGLCHTKSRHGSHDSRDYAPNCSSTRQGFAGNDQLKVKTVETMKVKGVASFRTV